MSSAGGDVGEPRRCPEVGRRAHLHLGVDQVVPSWWPRGALRSVTPPRSWSTSASDEAGSGRAWQCPNHRRSCSPRGRACPDETGRRPLLSALGRSSVRRSLLISGARPRARTSSTDGQNFGPSQAERRLLRSTSLRLDVGQDRRRHSWPLAVQQLANGDGLDRGVGGPGQRVLVRTRPVDRLAHPTARLFHDDEQAHLCPLVFTVPSRSRTIAGFTVFPPFTDTTTRPISV